MVNAEKMAHIREYEGFFSLRGALDCITMRSERKSGCPLAFRCDVLFWVLSNGNFLNLIGLEIVTNGKCRTNH